MSERSWDAFLLFLYDLPSQLRPGRQRIRVMRDNLHQLISLSVLPQLSSDDHHRLFPLGFSPAESDLKTAAGVGLERGLISTADFEQALRLDKAAGPFGFLQTVSGKTFGETVAPLIAHFWLVDEEDSFTKMRTTALYDFGWTPHEADRLIRVELKASAEKYPNFQQIRHPRMTDQEAVEPEYDVLLCLGVSNAGLEWWIFSASDVAAFIANKTFAPQHGGAKMASGTYWVRMTPAGRVQLSAYETNSESLRSVVQQAASRIDRSR